MLLPVWTEWTMKTSVVWHPELFRRWVCICTCVISSKPEPIHVLELQFSDGEKWRILDAGRPDHWNFSASFRIQEAI